MHREAFDLHHVVQREPIFQAMHAARVFRHIAANRAGNLAARVGRVIQAMLRHGLTDGQISHTALHDGRTAVFVDLQNFIELGERQGDA